MLNLLRFLTGYITVCFSGDNCERMLNLCAKHSVKLWNLRFNKGKIIGNIKAKDFYLLRKIRPERNIKIHILHKHGLLFKTVKYKKRFGFFVGICIFFLIIEFLSLFIWNIEISGNNLIKDTKLLRSCEEIGVKIGTKVMDIDTLRSAQKLLIKQKGLAWASFNIEGSKLTINVTEIKNPKEEAEELPSNLIASFDGEIEKIDVTSGNVLVKIGDTVQKGDVLVSGIIESQNSTCFVSSKGVIEGRTERKITVKGDYIQKHKIPTGKIKKRLVIEVFSIKIPLYFGEEKSDFISKYSSKRFRLFGEKLPIIKHEKTMEITEETTVVYTEDELLENLKEKLNLKIENCGFEIIKVGELEAQLTDKGITLSKSVFCKENIAQKQPILINSIN